MEFLKGPKEDGCVFCTRVGRKDDREDLILHRAKLSFVILNKYPYCNGHLMVVPNRHTADFASLTAAEAAEMHALTQHCVKALTQSYEPGGFNLGMNLGAAGGAGIRDHLHWHIVPRWVGDTNFLPVLSETRSMPQHLFDSYDALTPYFSRIK